MSESPALAHRYQCIYCATPCNALYRVYGVSAAKTIRLSRCTHCQRDVDPYCERELMLVILDCLLFREEAYRHFFFHRYRDLQLDTRESKILVLLASSCLRAYVISVAKHGVFEEKVARWIIYFLRQTILSGIVYGMQSQCIFGGILTLAKGTNEFSPLLESCSREGATNELFTQIGLSLLLPTACHVATIFVQIWEDSDTVRLMGSCLILAYQWFALNTILRGNLGVSSCSQTLIVTIVFVISLLVRDVALELIRLSWSERPSTICAGMELKIVNLWLWLPFLASKELQVPHLCLS
ncbi:hypothetical protein FisN_25Lh161 [Fistulifera solaris]|uniref:Protein ARV n=1 Tax=Fistulifera solaris TaxID=1519565 RepID=A0A1Z5KS07_FISSO|nr:hypothetical protein FisN_25Lh161 [Fistulifera solaris]|eukprot:GAX28781.1 hypothetical protein FisN_25Lh161 [Fistulifera solaris]